MTLKISNQEEFNRQNVFGLGQENSAYAQYFIGNSYLNPLTNPEETAVFLANVTFEPGCRNNWHIHHAKNGGGQLLICTAGSGSGFCLLKRLTDQYAFSQCKSVCFQYNRHLRMFQIFQRLFRVVKCLICGCGNVVFFH